MKGESYLFSHVSSSFLSRFVYLALHAPATQFIKDGSEKLTAKNIFALFFSHLVAFIPTRFKCQKANFPGVEFLEPALKLRKRRKKRQKLVVVGLSSIKRCVRRLHVVVDEQGRQRNVPKNMLIVYLTFFFFHVLIAVPKPPPISHLLSTSSFLLFYEYCVVWFCCQSVFVNPFRYTGFNN